MSEYESDQRVEPVHITTYRHLRRAMRRGWALPEPPTAPSLADLSRVRVRGRTERT